MQVWSLSLGLLLLCLAPAYQGKRHDSNEKDEHEKDEHQKGEHEKDEHQKGEHYCAESKDIEEYLDKYEDNIGTIVQLCYTRCCRDRCCDRGEEGKFWLSTPQGWEEKHGKHNGHGDDKHKKAHHAYKIVAIVLSAVVGVIIILAVAMVCYKKKVLKRQGSVAASLRNEKMKKYISHDTPQGKDGPMPDVETMKMPPAYFIASVPPPMYNLDANQSLPESLPTAPPSYSTINIQEAAGGFVVVQPAKEA